MQSRFGSNSMVEFDCKVPQKIRLPYLLLPATLLQTLFPEDGERIEIYVGNISYSNQNNSKGLLQIKEGIQDLDSVIGSTFQFWYTDFYEQQNCAETKRTFSCFTELGFSVNFVEFFKKSPTNLKYLNDIKFETDNSTQQLFARLSDIDPHDLSTLPKIKINVRSCKQ